MDALLQTLRNLGPMRLAIMGIVLFALLGFFIYLATRFTSPQMQLLYSQLDPQNRTAITTQLQNQGVPFEIRGNDILVPQDQVGPLRMRMAEQGLGAGVTTTGYEIFDQQGSLGTTNFQQNINLLRALEGELARTIETVNNVGKARVHLVLPKRELFQRQATQPSASVFLKMRGSQRLDTQQVMAVQHLVAAAVPGLLPRNISIVDDKGELLARGFEGDPATTPGLIAAQSDERRRSFENELQQEVEKLLEKVVGFGKVRVEISADMDFDRITTNEEIFDPDGQVVRSSQTIEQNRASQDQEPLPTSVATNLPDGGTPLGADAATRNATDSSVQENVNFEISKRVVNQVRDNGILNKLSAGIVVDGAYELNEDDDRVYRERTPEELQQIESLVKAAIGFDDARGDTVQVINMRFADPELPPEPQLDLFFGFQKQDLLQMAEMLVILILAILVILLVVRPLISRAFEALPAAAGALAEGGRAIADQAQLAAGALAAPPAPDGSMHEEEMFEELIDIDRVEGRVKASSVKKVGEIVDKHPEEALSIVRNWLYQEG